MKSQKCLILILFLLLFARPSYAQKTTYENLLIAQNDEIYDPFADYNEFEEASDEEADLNFFRNGRFFTLGMYGGYRNFTGVMGQIYKPSVAYGGYLTFFFDLRFAIQVSYIVGDHNFDLNVDSVSYKGSIGVSNVNFSLKYFLNTQNVTRGLDSFNPYIIGGLTQAYRTTRISGTDAYARDSGSGVHAGLGFEIPALRNKMYWGAEGMFEYVQFADEGQEIVVGNTHTGIYPKGDIFQILAVLGVNF